MAAKRYSLVFYAAIIVGLLSTFGVYRVLEVTKANARVATAPVVIAQKDLTEGASIDRMAVVVAQWPVGTIPAGAFTSIDSVAGRVTRVAVFKGEALVPGRLAPDGTGPGLEVKITPGKRAFAFRINDVSGIAGLIQPNSRVDILVVINSGGEKGNVARLFMENMRVLAIGAVAQRTEDGRQINAAVCTVEVTPEEGEKLAIATSQGQIQLLLRGYGDPDSAKTNGERHHRSSARWANRRPLNLRGRSRAVPRLAVKLQRLSLSPCSLSSRRRRLRSRRQTPIP